MSKFLSCSTMPTPLILLVISLLSVLQLSSAQGTGFNPFTFPFPDIIRFPPPDRFVRPVPPPVRPAPVTPAPTLPPVDGSEPLGRVAFERVDTCYTYLDIVRPIPNQFYFPFTSTFYRSGSRFGNVQTTSFFPPITPFVRGGPFRGGPLISTFDGAQGLSATTSVAGRGAAVRSSAAPAALTRAAPTTPAPTAPAADSFSTTNVQVAGVDEADIVKNDGRYIISIGGHQLVIHRSFGDSSNGQGQLLSRTNLNRFLFNSGRLRSPSLPGGYPYGSSLTFVGSDLLIQGDTLIVIGQARDTAPIRFPYFEPYLQTTISRRLFPTVVVIVLSLRNPRAPSLLNYHEIEGSYVTARETGGHAYLVLGQSPFLDRPASFDLASSIRSRSGISSADVMPVRRSLGVRDWSPVVDCRRIGYFGGFYYRSMLTVVGIESTTGAWTGADSVLGPWAGGSPAVVASLDSVYVALSWRTSEPWVRRFNDFAPIRPFRVRPGTAIAAFDIVDGRVTFRATGQASGTILNQFSMDEYDGVLRAAVTSQTTPTTNGIFTYDKNNMRQLGSVENLAPGERIFSARFIEDRGYMVTFRQVDPLFVVDLANPRFPRVLGELKIPGFSDYLHPAADKKLLGFGKSATDQGRTTGVKVALFDVTDPTNPTELDSLELGGPGSTSEILNDQKALLYSGILGTADQAYFVFPVELRSSADRCLFNSQTRAFYQGRPREESPFIGALLVRVDLSSARRGRNFQIMHRWTHDDDASVSSSQCSRFCRAAVVKRALFVGDVVYTLADKSIQAYPLTATLNGVRPRKIWEDELFRSVGGSSSSCTINV